MSPSGNSRASLMQRCASQPLDQGRPRRAVEKQALSGVDRPLQNQSDSFTFSSAHDDPVRVKRGYDLRRIWGGDVVNCANLAHGMWCASTQPPLAHRCRRAGAVHSIILDVSDLRSACPLCLRLLPPVHSRRFEIGQHRYCGGKVGSPWPIMLNFALCSSLSEA